MRLLTIGVGLRGAKIAELFYKKGVRVNGVPLFKCFAILKDEMQMKSIQIKDDRKFFAYNAKSVSGILNTLTNFYEIWEGSLLICSLEDDYAYEVTLELAEKLINLEEPVITLTLIPISGYDLKKKLKNLRKVSDVSILFEGTIDADEKIFTSLNMLSLAGEVDLKKKVAGEVVIDTSDVFNALKTDGFSVIGYAERGLPLQLFKKSGKAERTQRLLEVLDEAMQNLSISSDLATMTSALLLFSGPTEEIAAEAVFEAIRRIEKLNPEAVIRYGDCPISKRKVSIVILFSGIKRIVFR